MSIICPLFSAIYRMLSECKEDKCAWWNDDEEMCGILCPKKSVQVG